MAGNKNSGRKPKLQFDLINGEQLPLGVKPTQVDWPTYDDTEIANLKKTLSVELGKAFPKLSGDNQIKIINRLIDIAAWSRMEILNTSVTVKKGAKPKTKIQILLHDCEKVAAEFKLGKLWKRSDGAAEGGAVKLARIVKAIHGSSLTTDLRRQIKGAQLIS